MVNELNLRLIALVELGVIMIAMGVYGMKYFFSKRQDKPAPSITQHWLLTSSRKNRGVIRIDNMPKETLQKCIDIYKEDYGEDELPDSISPDGPGFVLTFDNIEYGAMCSWVALLTVPDTSTQYEIKGWFTLGDLSQEPDLKDLSDQTVMLFVPATEKDYDSVYFVAPDGKCYKQEFSDCGTLVRDPHVHQRYQEAPW